VEDEYLRVVHMIHNEFPAVRILPKGSSWFMRILSVLLFFNRGFMEDFVTTIGRMIWVPDDWTGWNALTRASILRHELVHLRQQEKYGMFLYAVIYLLFPLPFGLAWDGPTWRSRRMKRASGRVTSTSAATPSRRRTASRWSTTSPRRSTDGCGRFVVPSSGGTTLQ